jgi:4-hydroxybenzoate polyprenyltransferase
MKSSLSAYRRLFRIEHALMLCVAVLLAELLAARQWGFALQPELVLYSLLVPLFIEMASFALNDWFDVESDRENRREGRPLVTGEIGKDAALAASVVCYVLGVAAAAALPPLAFQIALLFAILSILYNWKLKDLPLLGNAYIAASMAIPFIFGAVVAAGGVSPQLLAISSVAFVAGLGREIVKSSEDIEGDVKHRGARTLPAVIGKKSSCFLSALLYFLLVPLSFLPFAYGLKASVLSLGLVIVTAVAFAAMGVSVMKNQSKENLEAARKASLLALGAGLLGYAASLIG